MTCAYSQSGDYKCQFEHQFRYQYNGPIIIGGELWCQFHAPLEDKNGNPTYKRKWIPDEIKRFHKGISELRESSVTKQEKLDLSGVVFPGYANFQGAKFLEVDFSHFPAEARSGRVYHPPARRAVFDLEAAGRRREDGPFEESPIEVSDHVGEGVIAAGAGRRNRGEPLLNNSEKYDKYR